jgi:aminoglycoside phosphotransferase (APT) family kinase protein
MAAHTPASDPAPSDIDVILDPAWLGAALSDIAPGERVVEVEQRGASETLARKVRFSIVLQAPDGRRRTRTYCVKAHFDVGGAETLLTEARFYQQLRPELEVRAPRAHYVGIDEKSGRAVVIMDDVATDGAGFLGAHAPYTADQSRDALAQLARLHAATWGERAWDVDWLQPRIATMGQFLPRDRLQALLDDGRADGLVPELRDAARLLRALRATAAVPTTCVIHGDPHSGNAYLDADGRVCWLDWQITQRGHWSTDVSYHLATTLDIDDRRATEAERLRMYLDELGRLGVEPPSWDEAWRSYTLGFTWGYFLWVITRISSRAVVLIHMPRLGAALADHDTFQRLGVD